MTDGKTLIERLRAGTGGGKHWMLLHEEAANEITLLRAELEACRVDAERYRVGHERYETVRRMNVPEFRDAYVESLRGCRTFDELVDAIGAGTKEPT
jgi:hypothetical protein